MSMNVTTDCELVALRGRGRGREGREREREREREKERGRERERESIYSLTLHSSMHVPQVLPHPLVWADSS